MRVKGQTLISGTALAVTTAGTATLDSLNGLAIQATYTKATPDPVTFASSDVSVADDTITAVAHGLVTGVKGQFTTDDTLPAGLSTSTNYWIIVVDADTLQVASTLANAVAGTAIDLTDQGMGNDTFTATTWAGNTIELQASNDGTNFTDITPALTLTDSGTTVWNIPTPCYRYLKVLFTPATGTTTLTVLVNGIAEVQ